LGRVDWDTLRQQGLAANRGVQAGANLPDIFLLFTLLEILDGPGSWQERFVELQTAEWPYEVEDVLASSGKWSFASARFLEDAINPEVAQGIRAEIVRRSSPQWTPPDKTPESPESVWERTLTRAVASDFHHQGTQTAVGKIMGTRQCSLEQLAAMRASCPHPGAAPLLANSLWCRALGGTTSPEVKWDLEDRQTHTPTSVRWFAIDTIHDCITEQDLVRKYTEVVTWKATADQPREAAAEARAGSTTEDTAEGSGDVAMGEAATALTEKAEVTILRWHRGPMSAAKCKPANKMITTGGQAQGKVGWCQPLRDHLMGTRTVKMGQMRVGITLDLPSHLELALCQGTTWFFLSLCHARGLDEVEALKCIAHALTTQLGGLVSARIQGCSFVAGKVNKFYDWYSQWAVVWVGFKSASHLATARATGELVIFDAESEATSALSVRVWFANSQPGDRAHRHLHYKEEARAKFEHVHISGFSSTALADLEEATGTVARTTEDAAAYFLDKLRLFEPNLAEEDVVLAPVPHKPQTWDRPRGMRIFRMRAEAAAALVTAISKGTHKGAAWSLLPHQYTLKAVMKKGPKEEDDQTSAPNAIALDLPDTAEAQAGTSTISEVVQAIWDALKQHGRLLLPEPGQTVDSQPLEPQEGTQTLRAALEGRLHGSPPPQMTEALLELESLHGAEVVRLDFVDHSGDQRRLEYIDFDEGEAVAGLEYLAISTAGADGQTEGEEEGPPPHPTTQGATADHTTQGQEQWTIVRANPQESPAPEDLDDDETLGMELEQLEAAEQKALASRKRRTPSPDTESGDSPAARGGRAAE
jgi:hypothetical protein